MTPEAYTRRCQFIGEIGCLACRRRGGYRPPDVHHLNLDQHAGQVTLGNEYTVGLCPWHHRGLPFEEMSECQTRFIAGPSMKHEPGAFRAEFGSDEELLAEENRLIAQREATIVGAHHA